MQDRIVIVTVALIVLLGAASAVAFMLPGGGQTATASIVSLATDKEVYHSQDTARITVDVSATGHLDGAVLRVEGIEDHYGRMRLFQEQNVTLQAGRNSFVVDYTLPVCSVCAGLYAGEYTISATLVRDGVQLASSTRTVTIG